MGESATNGQNGFLRILIAEEDDVGAFVAHCEINKLPYACSIQRVTKIEEVREKVSQFNPRIILIGERYSTPGFVSTLRRNGITLPIICLAKDGDDKTAQDVLKAGANDSLYSSQISDLANCLESHLAGKAVAPFYSRVQPVTPTRFISVNADKFQKFLQKLWARIEQGIANAPAEFRRLGRKTHQTFLNLRAGCSTMWKNIKIKSLVKTADLIVSTKTTTPEKPIAPTQPLEEKLTATDFFRVLPGGVSENLSNVSATSGNGLDTDLLSHGSRMVRPAETLPRQTADEEDKETFHALELAFKTLFHVSLDGLLLVDNTGTVLHANSAACALFGLRTAELLGKKFLDFVQPHNRSDAEATWEMLLTLASHEANLSILNARGELKELHLRGRTNLWFGVHLLVLKDIPVVRGMEQLENRESNSRPPLAS